MTGKDLDLGYGLFEEDLLVPDFAKLIGDTYIARIPHQGPLEAIKGRTIKVVCLDAPQQGFVEALAGIVINRSSIGSWIMKYGVSDRHAVFINLGSMTFTTPRQSKGWNNCIISIQAGDPSSENLSPAGLEIVKSLREGYHFDLTGDPLRGTTLWTRWRRKNVFDRRELDRRPSLHDYVDELVGYARHDPHGIVQRYGPDPGVRIYEDIDRLVRESR